MKMNEIYEAPVLEVLSVMIEKGFGVSDNSTEDPDIPSGGTPW